MADTTPYPITITRDAFVDSYACANCIAAFDAVAPGGVLAIADTAAHVALLSTPLAEFEEWAIHKGVLPPIHATVDDYGVAAAGVEGRATAGYRGTASAGDCGVAVAGEEGRATAGAWGQATAGYGGTATVGAWGRATAGDYGQATAGRYGQAAAGALGSIQIDRYVRRRRTAVGYIGETRDRDGSVLEAGVAYKVDSKGRFYRA